MRCPHCGSVDDKVVDSRPSPDHTVIRRRRACLACAARFTTFEKVGLVQLRVRKRSGVERPFDHEKVLAGMRRAAQGRVSESVLTDVAYQVELSLRALNEPSVSSEQVGLAVLAALKDVDEVTYVRFASVYKNFERPEDFAQELSTLRKDAPPKDETET
ncbi:MAG: transcriptional regulator NrdR [Nitriliruptoraceae bacterium]